MSPASSAAVYISSSGFAPIPGCSRDRGKALVNCLRNLDPVPFAQHLPLRVAVFDTFKQAVAALGYFQGDAIQLSLAFPVVIAHAEDLVCGVG